MEVIPSRLFFMVVTSCLFLFSSCHLLFSSFRRPAAGYRKFHISGNIPMKKHPAIYNILTKTPSDRKQVENEQREDSISVNIV